jgi:hypothetical protein
VYTAAQNRGFVVEETSQMIVAISPEVEELSVCRHDANGVKKIERRHIYIKLVAEIQSEFESQPIRGRPTEKYRVVFTK